MEHTAGDAAVDEAVAEARLVASFFDDTPIADPGVPEMFGVGVYVRGALTLYALRSEVGLTNTPME